MGHDMCLKFSAQLNKLGRELLIELTNTSDLKFVSNLFYQYKFIEKFLEKFNLFWQKSPAFRRRDECRIDFLLKILIVRYI